MKRSALNRNRSWLHKRKVGLRLKEKFGKQHWKRILTGVDMVATFWKREDGTAEDFAKFCEEYFVTDPKELEILIKKFADAMEQIFGTALDLYRRLHRPLHLDGPPISKWDRLFVRVDPFTAAYHTLFESKVAFAALLNFPSYSTEEMFMMEGIFTRQQWIECRLTDSLRCRVPSVVERRVNDAYLDAEAYISEYKIHSGSLVDLDGNGVFAEDKELLSHWGIRDELSSQYFQENGLARQWILYEVMKKIILQKVPEAVINSSGVFWDPARNLIRMPETSEWTSCETESNVRYAHLRNIFLAEKASDRYFSRDFLERSFMDSCEIPEETVKNMIIGILTAPVAKDVAKVVRNQLGRKLLPFDIWYNKFLRHNEKELDPVIKEKYPTPEVFNRDIPNILKVLGFHDGIAELIGANIHVDSCRGSGHAWGSLRREDKVLLRTRFQKDGLDSQGFDVGMHELGHSAEMVMCMHLADNSIMAGLPNIGFSEAFAFLFEMRKLEALGIKSGKKDKYYLVLNNFWNAFEIAGVALLDMLIWRWLYKNKDAKPEEVNNAIRYLAKSIWNKYFAPVLGVRDEYLLAIYSHIIGYGLYVPNYAIGSIVTFQVLNFCRGKHWPTEMERMCKIGAVSPNAWLKQAVGSPLSLKPMFKLVKDALKKVE